MCHRLRGPECQYGAGTLTLHVICAIYISVDVDARKDIFFTNDPDLYVKVTAHNKEGKRKTKSTRILKGTTAPRWNQDLEFGKTTWDYFLEFGKSTLLHHTGI